MTQKRKNRLLSLFTRKKTLNKLKTTDYSSEIEEKVDFKNADFNTRVRIIKEYMNYCDDMKYIEFSLDPLSKNDSYIIYINSLTDDNEINQKILNPLLNITLKKEVFRKNSVIEVLFSKGILSVQYKTVNKFRDIINLLLAGETIILSKKSKDCYAIPTKEEINYPISESETETSLVGPKTAFTNNININIRLIRSYIKSHKLKIRSVRVGKYTKSNVLLMYLEDLAPIEVVDDIVMKTQEIYIDGILDVTYIEEILNPREFCLFPQALKTERVDRVLGNLLEGRIAMLVNGSNSAAIMPITFSAFFQTPEDYYTKPIFATFLRLFRYGAFLVASLATPFYVAISIYHYEVIPFKLLIPFGESIAPIPFPPFFEAMLLEVFAQVLSESSTRMSGTMGPMIGILGAVLVGQAAVQANLASPVLVITVAIGVVSSFSIPNNDFIMAARVIKFVLIIFAGVFSGFGIGIVLMTIIIHLCSLESFGVPYLTGIAPFKLKNFQDMFFRSPHKFMKNRPSEIKNRDRVTNIPKGNDRYE